MIHLIVTVGTGTAGEHSNLVLGLRRTLGLIGAGRYWLVPSGSPDSVTAADLVREGMAGIQWWEEGGLANRWVGEPVAEPRPLVIADLWLTGSGGLWPPCQRAFRQRRAGIQKKGGTFSLLWRPQPATPSEAVCQPSNKLFRALSLFPPGRDGATMRHSDIPGDPKT